MRGIILAGGNGTRLAPLTDITNKHLLPVYDKPMIHWPVKTLKDNGITEIMIITGSSHMGDDFRYLGSGKDFGCNFTFRIQDGAGGIAEALGLTKDFVKDEESFAVILGDNIFTKTPHIKPKPTIYLQKVNDPERFGCPVFENNKLIGIEEKPKVPKSPFAVTGLYVYDNRVFDIISDLKPSARGELEITDVNNQYLEWGMNHEIIDGIWFDAGTFDSLLNASQKIKDTRWVD